MSDNIRIFHNPRCSKSRATLGILNDKNAGAEIVEYLKNPPTEDELDAILQLLSLEPRDLMRKQETPYKVHGLDDPSLNRRQLIRFMVENPVLIERPIVIKGQKAIIGRPPENVLDIL